MSSPESSTTNYFHASFSPFAKPAKVELPPSVPESHRVYFRGEDVTPYPIGFASIEKISTLELKQSFAQRSKIDSENFPDENNEASSSSIRLITESASKFHTELRKQGMDADSSLAINTTLTLSSLIDAVIMKQVELPALSEGTYEIMSEDLDNELLSAIVHRSHKRRGKIKITLVETNTEELFELPSKTVELNTPEGKLVEKENDRYDFLTIGKGKNRKMVPQETQTIEKLLKKKTMNEKEKRQKGERKVSKRTCTSPVRKIHNFSYVSYYEMYDTYEEIKRKELEKKLESHLPTMPLKTMVGMDEEPIENKLTRTELELYKLGQNENFFEAAYVIERLLANRSYNYQQKRYRGIIKVNPFRSDIKYRYNLNHLWTYSNEKSVDRCVSCGAFNPANHDLLAVGFGKFYFTDVCTGLVLIWSIKNPVQPERIYEFEEPVTCLAFSSTCPNILAVGFYNGKIFWVDTSQRHLKIIMETGEDSPSHLPVWQVLYYPPQDHEREMLMAIFHDGRICMYTNTGSQSAKCIQIMRITNPEGKQKGLPSLRKCRPKGLQCNEYIPALTVRRHPQNKYHYYIGTSHGTIHRCSTHYYQHYIDIFKAHDGGVSSMQTSPFCNKIYVTTGNDWCCRIWVEELVDPLIELAREMETCEGAAWSPTHSAILVSLTGNDIYLWDMQRKTYQPQAIYQTPTNGRNTLLMFTQNGQCLLIGDVEGNIHVFSLEDMPFPAFYGDALLTNIIKKALKTKPDLLKQVEKIGNLSYETVKSGKYFD